MNQQPVCILKISVCCWKSSINSWTKGNTVIVIEHNLDVIKVADHIIDLGPEGGKHGGRILCTGTPEEVALNKKSYTAKFLKQELGL